MQQMFSTYVQSHQMMAIDHCLISTKVENHWSRFQKHHWRENTIPENWSEKKSLNMPRFCSLRPRHRSEEYEDATMETDFDQREDKSREWFSSSTDIARFVGGSIEEDKVHPESLTEDIDHGLDPRIVWINFDIWRTRGTYSSMIRREWQTLRLDRREIWSLCLGEIWFSAPVELIDRWIWLMMTDGNIVKDRKMSIEERW